MQNPDDFAREMSRDLGLPVSTKGADLFSPASVRDSLKLALESNTQQRIDKLAASTDLLKSANLPTVFAGNKDGIALVKTLGSEPIPAGKIITTYPLAIGDPVLARPDEGLIYLDQQPRTEDYSELLEEDTSPETRSDDSCGWFFNSATKSCQEILPINGKCPAQGWLNRAECEANKPPDGEQPPSPNPWENPDNRSPGDSTMGCNIGAEPDVCQWFPASSYTQARNAICPPGMRNSGAVEFSSGTILYLCCTNDGLPAKELGIGCDWKGDRYKCQNGVCVVDPSGVYGSLSECQAALVQPFIGGQCPVLYNITVTAYIYGSTGGLWRTVTSTIYNAQGPLIGFRTNYAGPMGHHFGVDTPWGYWLSHGYSLSTGLGRSMSLTQYEASYFDTSKPFNPFERYVYVVETIARVDGNPDNCGDPPKVCPS